MNSHKYIGPKSRDKLFHFLEENNVKNILLIIGSSSGKELLIKSYLDKIKSKYINKEITKRDVNFRPKIVQAFQPFARTY